MRFLKILLITLISSFNWNYYVCHSLIADDGNNNKETDIVNSSGSEAVDSSKDTAASSTKIESAQNFINDTGNQVIKILVNKSMPLTQRQDQFRQVIKDKFLNRSILNFNSLLNIFKVVITN